MRNKSRLAREVKVASESLHLFQPVHGLPVLIDFAVAGDPYQLSEHVRYQNTVVHVAMPRGFQWDGCSIPSWVPLLPWIVSLAVMRFCPAFWPLVIVALCYSVRLLPFMQKMGRHARAAAVHDRLYRTQPVARVVADAIMLSIMEYDRVPWDVRMIIYIQLRLLGWIAWRRNARSIDSANKAMKASEI
jgi:hypothetical protein